MTPEERAVMDNLVKAYNAFTLLPSTHPDHAAEFRRGLHECQSVLIHRIVQRGHPTDFPTYR